MNPLLIYILLSPTFGMHQYTADLANRAVGRGAGEQRSGGAGENASPIPGPRSSIHLITTGAYPADRYAAHVSVHTPLRTTGTGFGREGLDIAAFRRVLAAVDDILARERGSRGVGERGPSDSPCPPAPLRLCPLAPVLHLTGVHLWNPLLLAALRRRGVRTIHTLHDLDPHHGVRFAALIRLWNRLVIRQADHILVHARRYRDRLIAQGLAPQRVTYTPLLHGFWGADKEEIIGSDAGSLPPSSASTPTVIADRSQATIMQATASQDRPPLVLFFGRVETYKGIAVLLAAWEKMTADLASASSRQHDARLLLAGRVAADMQLPPLPAGVDLYDRRIDDEEGIELFQRCSLLVLPYRDATQSALIAAAYFFARPVLVTRAGALPEYVIEGETGWVVPPNDSAGLAAALQQALADPDRLRRMGEAGRRWYEVQRQQEQRALQEMYSAVVRHGG